MSVHTSITVTAALAAMSCSVPGLWLLLRRHSMMGDALSHTALPGIVAAFLVATALRSAGWISASGLAATEHLLLLVGAAAAGLLTAWLTEWVQRYGRVEGNAALGVVFISLFALGLFLIRFAVDGADLDTDCVLFGRVEVTVLDSRLVFGQFLPYAAIVNGCMLLLNLLLLALFYKELQIATFDPGLSNVQGINARAVHYAHLVVTAVTAVAAFETVGSLLVVGLLVVPAATAQLLTLRLKPMILLTLLIAGGSAVLGHWMSQSLPSAIFSRLGYLQIEDASTSGMIAVTAGMLFFVAWLITPQQGLVAGLWNRTRLAVRIISEDLLGALYRQGERHPDQPLSRDALTHLSRHVPAGAVISRWVLSRFARRGLVAVGDAGYTLTLQGEQLARQLIRGHRLWEVYVDRHFELPPDHLDSSAHVAEHYLTDDLRDSLEFELDRPESDPHGRDIPGGVSEDRR
ncbi:MAG: metal ABC transporter permease [Planctomycetaceae bacterium]|nr:metal ABC transporter permease [Planctomycetaceae bacterium]